MAYLEFLGYGNASSILDAEDAFASDPDCGGERMKVRRGMWLRLSRNLDKDRGFVNGALGRVEDVLQM